VSKNPQSGDILGRGSGQDVRPAKIRVDTGQGLPSNDTVEDGEAHHRYEVEYAWEESPIVPEGVTGDNHLAHS
jgi:hypothetical protein